MAAESHPSQTPPAQHPPTPGQAAVEPSGPTGGDPSTAGPGQTGVRSDTPENKLGYLNPSAPEDSNVTPGSTVQK